MNGSLPIPWGIVAAVVRRRGHETSEHRCARCARNRHIIEKSLLHGLEIVAIAFLTFVKQCIGLGFALFRAGYFALRISLCCSCCLNNSLENDNTMYKCHRDSKGRQVPSFKPQNQMALARLCIKMRQPMTLKAKPSGSQTNITNEFFKLTASQIIYWI